MLAAAKEAYAQRTPGGPTEVVPFGIQKSSRSLHLPLSVAQQRAISSSAAAGASGDGDGGAGGIVGGQVGAYAEVSGALSQREAEDRRGWDRGCRFRMHADLAAVRARYDGPSHKSLRSNTTISPHYEQPKSGTSNVDHTRALLVDWFIG